VGGVLRVSRARSSIAARSGFSASTTREHWPNKSVVPARNVVPKPNVDWEVAGSYGLVFGTAYRMLRRARLTAGEALLVVGIGGGVASAAFQLGLAMGADVMVTSRDQAKLDWAVINGATAAVKSDEAFSKALPRKADVVVESVGPATFDQSVRSTAAGGRIAVCGSTSGQKIELTVPVLFFKQLEIIGSTMFTHEEFRQVTSLVDSHKVHPQVDNAFDVRGTASGPRQTRFRRSTRQGGASVLTDRRRP
jgi:NADPH:quinone reductase-like Zn-dependent oxidoreductase